MRSSSGRPFGLMDAVTLVAATACGMAPVKGTLSVFRGRPLANLPNARVGAFITTAIEAASPLMLAWTVAVLVMALRQPRPPIHRLARRPGFVACAAVACWAIFHLAFALPAKAYASMSGRGSSPYFWSPIAHSAAPVVVAAWLAMSLGGRWRAEPTWLDRSGRALGVMWIAMDLLGRARGFL